MKRILLGGCLLIAATLANPQPVSAHGGTDTDLTSDYRTRVTEVPVIEGLDVQAVGLDGTIKLSWTGAGTLIVVGYEGEPYLRFDDSGVAVNTRSPAAYLNQDRYANVDVPATADPDAVPDWQPAATGNTYQWHDHRTHWMSPALPPQAADAPDRSHVIYERWEIPLDIEGRDYAVAGDLTWAPSPPLWPWVGFALLLTAISTALLWSRFWRPSAAALATIGTAALTVDTAGFVATIDDNLANKAWAFVYGVAALLATVRLFVHARRRTPEPTLAVMAAGFIFALMGGLDRLDVLTSGFYQSKLDITAARIATTICLAAGIALLSRFFRFLLPLLVSASHRTRMITGDSANV